MKIAYFKKNEKSFPELIKNLINIIEPPRMHLKISFIFAYKSVNWFNKRINPR